MKSSRKSKYRLEKTLQHKKTMSNHGYNHFFLSPVNPASAISLEWSIRGVSFLREMLVSCL